MTSRSNFLIIKGTAEMIMHTSKRHFRTMARLVGRLHRFREFVNVDVFVELHDSTFFNDLGNKMQIRDLAVVFQLIFI